ncbi:hypothetical protein, partial [Streptomyces sp. YIM 98790]|uniref:hypothetical protein n=1 Tax=Streptomyces sp. YIM 98790 TaxID=2689077 RepID=UPI001A9CFB4F
GGSASGGSGEPPVRRRLRLPGLPRLPRPGTRRLLAAQSVLLTLLTALATGLLYDAYREVHRRPPLVRDRTAPAVLEVAAVRAALVNAHLEAGRTLASGVSEVIGPGQEYRAQIASATQSLSRVAELQVAGADGEQWLSTINAQLLAYNERITEAADHSGALSRAHFLSADSLLHRDATGILDRLEELQQRQQEVLVAETTFTGTRRELWQPAGVAVAALALALAVVQWQLARRFPQRFNPALLAASALLLAAWAAVPRADATRERLDDARAGLQSVIREQQLLVAGVAPTGQSLVFVPSGEGPPQQPQQGAGRAEDGNEAGAGAGAGAGERIDERIDEGIARVRTLMTEVTDDVDTAMDATDPGSRAVVAIPAGGGLVTVLVLAGLQRHLAQYRIRR